VRSSESFRTVLSGSGSSKVDEILLLIESMRLPINNQYLPWSYLAPFRRYGRLKVENRQFVPTQSHKSPSLGVTPFQFRDELMSAKTRMFGLFDGVEIMTLTLWIQYQSECDGRTDRQTDGLTIPALA